MANIDDSICENCTIDIDDEMTDNGTRKENTNMSKKNSETRRRKRERERRNKKIFHKLKNEIADAMLAKYVEMSLKK